MTSYRTKAWVIGLLIGSLIATLVVGLVHETGILEMIENPILHLIEDWIIVLIPLLPITYIVVRIIK